MLITVLVPVVMDIEDGKVSATLPLEWADYQKAYDSTLDDCDLSYLPKGVLETIRECGYEPLGFGEAGSNSGKIRGLYINPTEASCAVADVADTLGNECAWIAGPSRICGVRYDENEELDRNGSMLLVLLRKAG